MKVLFFIIAIVAFSTLSAQNLGKPWVKPITPELKTISPRQPKIYPFQQARPRLLQTLPNGSKVFALPMSNMPCIVPDLSQYNYNMPVVKPRLTPTMPNPAMPPFNKPPVMTEEQLKKLMEMLNHPQVIFK